MLRPIKNNFFFEEAFLNLKGFVWWGYKII